MSHRATPCIMDFWYDIIYTWMPWTYSNRFYPRLFCSPELPDEVLIRNKYSTSECVMDTKQYYMKKNKTQLWASVIYILCQNILFIYRFICPNNYHFYEKILNIWRIFFLKCQRERKINSTDVLVILWLIHSWMEEGIANTRVKISLIWKMEVFLSTNRLMSIMNSQ